MGLLLRALYVLLKGFIFSFWTKLWSFLLFAMPWVVRNVLILLGIGFLSYSAFDFAIDKFEQYIFGKFDGLIPDLLKIMIILKLDVGIAIIFAAMSLAISIKSVAFGSKLIFKSKGTFEA